MQVIKSDLLFREYSQHPVHAILLHSNDFSINLTPKREKRVAVSVNRGDILTS